MLTSFEGEGEFVGVLPFVRIAVSVGLVITIPAVESRVLASEQ
jgi:hypothetical protein